MIEGIVQQFLGSGEASQVLGQLQQQGMTPTQARGAVTATAEGAAQAASQGGVGALLGSAGVAGALGGLMGGGGSGGLGGMLGTLGGGGAASGTGLPPQLVDTVAQIVSQRTGLSAEMAKTAVNVVLPKVVDFVTSKLS